MRSTPTGPQPTPTRATAPAAVRTGHRPRAVVRDLIGLGQRCRAVVLGEGVRGERGASIAEVLAYTALSVAALVALFALFNALGADVVTQVRRRLGLGG